MAEITTKQQISAGGVVFRRRGEQIDVVLIAVLAKGERRWQLPKGIVDPGEEPAATALREVQEETGLLAEIVAALETIEYWYYGGQRAGKRIRFHKFVHFFLMRCLEGDTANHDHEVAEACWVALPAAAAMLAFKSEQKVTRQAAEILAALD